jgi:poly-gamma-glutamate synthesis protein (capsule biosynthesis protein)
MQVLAHAVIDAGADVFLGHGPHVDRGVEFYRGKPILYSLGQFVVQNDTVSRMPQESMSLYGLGLDATPADLFDTRRVVMQRREIIGRDPHHQSAVAMVTFGANSLMDVKLYPIQFGHDLPRSQSGRPILSEGEEATETLRRFQHLSEPFGTAIEIQGEVGVIRASAQRPSGFEAGKTSTSVGA